MSDFFFKISLFFNAIYFTRTWCSFSNSIKSLSLRVCYLIYLQSCHTETCRYCQLSYCWTVFVGFYLGVVLKKCPIISGVIDDGWTIDGQLGQNTHAITTQVQEPCPTQINRGIIYIPPSYRIDNTLSVKCVDETVEKEPKTAEKPSAEFNTKAPLHAHFVFSIISPVIMTVLMWENRDVCVIGWA